MTVHCESGMAWMAGGVNVKPVGIVEISMGALPMFCGCLAGFSLVFGEFFLHKYQGIQCLSLHTA